MAAKPLLQRTFSIVDAYGVGREIVQTTVNAMGITAEKERDSVLIKRHGYWLSLIIRG